MAKPADVIENNLAGDRIVFLRTGLETNGELLVLEAIYGMAQDGKLPPRSIPNLLHFGVVLSEFHDADIVTQVPLTVQKILGLFGRLAGYKCNYPYPYDNPKDRAQE